MTAAFQGEYLNCNSMKTDMELILLECNLICVCWRIVHKSLVERLLQAGVGPVYVLHCQGQGLQMSYCMWSKRIFILPLFFADFMTCVKYSAFTKEWCSFKSWKKKIFSPYMGTTYTVSNGNCPKFLMCYQQFTSHAYCGAAGPASKMHEKQTAGSTWETWTVAAADSVCCARVW
jgi:hypothetical protein